MFTACSIMRRRSRQAACRYIMPQAVKIANSPEDGRNHRPKHVELIRIINKPLLLHLVGVYINGARSNKYQN